MDSRSERILLLLQPGRDRELFAERLDDREVVVGDPDEPLPEFDLCLVDTATYPAAVEALAERKTETGVHLPVLLVVGPDERTTVVRETADIADDVLPLPTSEPILRSRVNSLLRARRDSLELDAERERFRTLAETAPNAILTIDTAGIVQYANPAVEQVFGYQPEAVVGEPLTMLMPPGLREAHQKGLSQYLETGERSLDWTGARLPGWHADGHEIPLLLAFAEHRTGGERRFTGIVQDVTEHVEREQELERTVDLFERTQSMADIGGWEIDVDTLEVTWTDQVYEILGLPRDEEPPLEEALDVYHPEDRPVIEDAVETALDEGEPFDETVRIQRADGEVRWVRVLGEAGTVNGEVETLRGAFQDITERRNRQAELERTLDMLDRTGEIAGVGGFENDFDTGEVVWTDQTYEILEVPRSYEPDIDELIEFYHPEDRERVESELERALETGEPFDIEVRIVTGEDRERWARLRGAPTRGEGQVLRGTIQDITERKERERELERYETVLETVPEGAWIVDEERRLTFVNGRVAASMGREREELIGRPPEAFLGALFPDEATLERYLDALDGVLEGETTETQVTLELATANGPMTFEITLVALEREGAIDGAIGISRDITDRIERQRELERAVDMLDRAESIADVGGWQYDPAADELTWTEQVYHIHGLDPTDGEPPVEDAIDFYHPEDRPVIAEAFERALEEGEPYDLELRIIRPDGEERWVRAIGEPDVVDGRRMVRGAFQDIHARKEREQERERAVEQLEQTRDIADVSGWEYDPDTDEVWWDEKVWEIYGQLPSFEPTVESVMGLYTPESRARMEAAMERAVIEFEPFDIEIEIDTEPARWVRVTGEPQVEDGRTTVVRGVVRDITRRKRREEYLERHERIVETADEPIYTLDGDLRFTLVNGALADLFDRDQEALLGEHVSTLFGDAHAEALGDAATKLYARDEGETLRIETTITDAAGRTRHFQTTLSPKLDAEGFQGLVCVGHDVTEVTEHEHRLSVLDRVLRHNLRNKMNVVLARARSIRETATDEATAEAGASIEAAAEELLGLGEAARQFHDALDPSGTEFVDVEDIAEHARHVVEAARHSYTDATIEADLPATAPALAHTEFELALSELVDNATTHGGPGTTVTVEVETVDDEVVVKVLDDGPGVPELERKALAAGWESPLQHATGLGLWFVQWTVTNSGGTMTIDDREGGGAVVELRLPAAKREA